MLVMIARRLLIGIFTLWLVTVLVFIATEILPGDVAQVVLGQSATPETVAALREKMGLNDPAIHRYVNWLAGFVTGDLGVSIASGADISQLIGERLRNTLLLAGVTAVIVVPLAIGLGLVAAMYPESPFDRGLSVVSMIFVSVPEFLLATVVVMLFAVQLGWFPAVSYVTEFRSFGHMVSTLALPVLALSASLTAQMSRMTRAAVINILGSPYIEMALLKGIDRRRIVLRHAAANAIGPIANIVALNLAYLVSGVVIVETIFAFPGLAKLIVDGVASRDFPVVQSCAMVFCAAYILLMLVADIVAIISNPRLRAGDG